MDNSCYNDNDLLFLWTSSHVGYSYKHLILDELWARLNTGKLKLDASLPADLAAAFMQMAGEKING